MPTTRLHIYGERGTRAVVLLIEAVDVIDAIETGTIKKFDAGQIAAAMDAIENIPDGHALEHVRDSARARRHANDVLKLLELAQP